MADLAKVYALQNPQTYKFCDFCKYTYIFGSSEIQYELRGENWSIKDILKCHGEIINKIFYSKFHKGNWPWNVTGNKRKKSIKKRTSRQKLFSSNSKLAYRNNSENGTNLVLSCPALCSKMCSFFIAVCLKNLSWPGWTRNVWHAIHQFNGTSCLAG